MIFAPYELSIKTIYSKVAAFDLATVSGCIINGDGHHQPCIIHPNKW